jgi:hypothetical protein
LIKTKIQSVPSTTLRVFEKHSKKSLRVNLYYPLKLAKANVNPKPQIPKIKKLKKVFARAPLKFSQPIFALPSACPCARIACAHGDVIQKEFLVNSIGLALIFPEGWKELN